MSTFDYATANFARNRLPQFDRSRRRFAVAPDNEPALDERATPSSQTNMAIRSYFEAREGGDFASAWDAVRDAAMSWRADNNAGGLPVYGHLPLPRPFAAEVARDVNNGEEDRETALNDLLSRFDPGLATHVKSQLDQSARADPPSGLGDGARSASKLPGSMSWRTLEYVPARDGAADVRTLPWDGRRSDAVSLSSQGDGAIGMIPGGGTPPAPARPPRESAPAPLGPASDRTFRPDRDRPPPSALSNEVLNDRGVRHRRYQVGSTRVDVPIDENEADVVAGLDYLNNLKRPDGSPVVSGSFVNDSTGTGVTVVDAPGGVVTAGSASQYYPWEYLRALGRFARQKPPLSRTGARLTWRAPTEKANLEPDWAEAQRRYRRGDGSDAVIDPERWGVSDDADEFADNAQRAANGEAGFSGNLRRSIAQAQATGEPQFVDILLPGSGPLYGARGLVMGRYAIRVRGIVIVKDGKYRIVGRATIVDAGRFNYDQDGQRNRSATARWALWATQFLPDPTDTSKIIADPGRDYTIRANRDADVELWGMVR